MMALSVDKILKLGPHASIRDDATAVDRSNNNILQYARLLSTLTQLIEVLFENAARI